MKAFKALVIRPDKITIEELNGWEGIKDALDGGLLELLTFREDLVGYIDEDGKSKGLPLNRTATSVVESLLSEVGRTLMFGDKIVGTLVLCGAKVSDDPEEGIVECDLPKDVLQKLIQ